MGGSKAQRKRRVRRVLELSTAGMTIPDISDMMKDEGFAASERTVWNDLNSVEAKDYLAEILRKQLTDITIADIGLRLKFRGKLLDNLMPKKIEQKLDATGDLNFVLRAWRPDYDKEKDDEDGRGHN